MKEDRILLIDLIEKEIRKAMKKDKEDYNIGFVDGLIKAINLLEIKQN